MFAKSNRCTPIQIRISQFCQGRRVRRGGIGDAVFFVYAAARWNALRTCFSARAAVFGFGVVDHADSATPKDHLLAGRDLLMSHFEWDGKCGISLRRRREKCGGESEILNLEMFTPVTHASVYAGAKEMLRGVGGAGDLVSRPPLLP